MILTAFFAAGRRIYRGEWQKGKMQGCGVRLARQSTREGPVFSAEEGMFMDDEWVGDIMACNAEQSRAAAYEADVASSMARAFQVRALLAMRPALVMPMAVGVRMR